MTEAARDVDEEVVPDDVAARRGVAALVDCTRVVDRVADVRDDVGAIGIVPGDRLCDAVSPSAG